MNERQAAGILKRMKREVTPERAAKFAAALANVPHQDAVDAIQFLVIGAPVTPGQIRAALPKVMEWRKDCIKGAKSRGLVPDSWPDHKRLDDRTIAKLQKMRERDDRVSRGLEPPEFDILALPKEERNG